MEIVLEPDCMIANHQSLPFGEVELMEMERI